MALMEGARHTLRDLSYFSTRARAGVPPDFPSRADAQGAAAGTPSPQSRRCPPVPGLQRKVHERPGAAGRHRSPAGRCLLCFLPRTAWGTNAPVPAVPKAPGHTKRGGGMIPKLLFRQLCHQKYYSSSQLVFCFVVFCFFSPSLSQVFKTLWTFPCHSTSLGKWEGRKAYRGSQK